MTDLTETSTLSHSHMPVQHLLKQVETYRAGRTNRGLRPEWVTKFIDRVADLFEPSTDVARAGFDCRLAEDRWVIDMYLGSIELVGGKEDGKSRNCEFQFDLHRLLGYFSDVDKFHWHAISDRSQGDEQTSCASIVIEGIVEDSPLRLRVCSIPPTEAGPGFLEFPDGRCDPA